MHQALCALAVARGDGDTNACADAHPVPIDRERACQRRQDTLGQIGRTVVAIKAYEDFVAGGGDLYVPTPEEKAAFKEAAAPVYDWFKGNVGRGGEIFGALEEAVAAAEADINANRSADLN